MHALHNIMAELSTEILFFNILPRLPGKSISRFRCVSKQWNSFLNTLLFNKMHLHHQSHHKLLLFTDTTPCTSFRTIDCEAPEGGLSANRSLPFVASSSKNITILGSCNGLVCVGITEERCENGYYSYMILWNPLTGEYKRMSEANADHICYNVTGSASELYYNASADNYNVLRVTKDGDAYIYSLKANSWRKLHSTEDLTSRPNLVWGASILHYGNIYFIDEAVRRTSLGQLSYSIIKFNANTEKFTVMGTPFFGDETTVCLNSMLLERDGKLHLCVIYKVNSTEFGGKLWRMDGDGYWKKVVTYQIPIKFYYLNPLHLMKNGNWVTVCRSGCHVNELDPGRDFKKSSYAKPAHKIDFRRKGVYIETFVSPNRKME